MAVTAPPTETVDSTAGRIQHQGSDNTSEAKSTFRIRTPALTSLHGT